MRQDVIARAIDQARTLLKYPRSPLSTKIAKAVIDRWERQPARPYRCRR